MKKFGLLILGGIAAIVLLSNLGSMIGLLIGLVILYYAFKAFMKAGTTFKKIVWGAIGLIALAATASNVPAILGVAAIYILYIVYKKWNAPKKAEMKDDPFTNFEKQWAELNK